MTQKGAQIARDRYGWHRAVASAALAVGLMAGFGVAAAQAEPADPATPATATDAPQQPMTADQVLVMIDQEYDTGAGGGQVSNLIHQVLRLRAQGIPPSNANKDAIVKALDYRPNQGPLVKALKDTLAYQTKKAQQMQQPSNPFTIGVNQLPSNAGESGNGAGIFIDPGGSNG